MRAIFSGTLNFSMLSIGVKLFSAQKDNSIKFNFLCPYCHSKVAYKRVCEKCGKEIPYNQLLKGYYLSQTTGYVAFTKEEIKAIESETQKSIDIIGFSDENIDYLLLDKTYYLLPAKGSERPYFFFKELLSLTGKSAIAKITMRNKQKLCLIRPYRKVLTLTTLYNIDDIVDSDFVLAEQNIKAEEVRKEELELGKQLVSLANLDFEKAVRDFKDNFRELFKELVMRKLNNQPIVIKNEKIEERMSEIVDVLKKMVEIEKKKKMEVYDSE